jgi:hypothetical protein
MMERHSFQRGSGCSQKIVNRLLHSEREFWTHSRHALDDFVIGGNSAGPGSSSNV